MGAKGTMLISVDTDPVCLKISGWASFALAADFRRVWQELEARGHRRLCLEVSECEHMDSTFLGILSSVAVRMKGTNGEPGLEILNPSDRLQALFKHMGIARLFSVRRDAGGGAGALTPVASGNAPTRLEQTQLLHQAHQTLMDIDPANVPKFHEVVRFLEEDLKRLQSRS